MELQVPHRFRPKFRRKVFYGERRREIGEILRKLCEWKLVNIVEAEVCPDHVHMLLEIPPKVSVSGFMNVYISFCKINNSRERPVQVPVKKWSPHIRSLVLTQTKDKYGKLRSPGIRQRIRAKAFKLFLNLLQPIKFSHFLVEQGIHIFRIN